MEQFSLPPLELYIDGVWTRGSSGRVFDIVNPANEQVIGTAPVASSRDLDDALSSAARSFKSWRDTAPAARTAILIKAANLVRQHATRLARLTTLELGVRFSDAMVLVERAAEVLEWDANEGRRLYGRVLPSEPGLRQMVVREPIGPVAAFAPWNGSVFTPCRKIGSALAAGCSLILKAAEEAPISTIALVRLFEEAGVPKGVLNLVFGDPAAISRHLIESPIIRMISFTGSIPIGKQLNALAAAQMKPAIMELGGHAPVIVCADANLEAAATALLATKFANAGQVCFSPSRVFVERPVVQEFTDLLAAKARQILVGDGMDPATAMGPLATKRRLEGVDRLVRDAVGAGAKLACGGQRLGDIGYYYAPTVLTDVPDGAAVMREEPFGPILTVAPFDDLYSALEDANSLPYGLAAYAFTRSASVADRIARSLECGMVAINNFGVSTHGMPFGGVKDSGVGREGGIEGISGHTIVKTVTHRFD